MNRLSITPNRFRPHDGAETWEWLALDAFWNCHYRMAWHLINYAIREGGEHKFVVESDDTTGDIRQEAVDQGQPKRAFRLAMEIYQVRHTESEGEREREKQGEREYWMEGEREREREREKEREGVSFWCQYALLFRCVSERTVLHSTSNAFQPAAGRQVEWVDRGNETELRLRRDVARCGAVQLLEKEDGRQAKLPAERRSLFDHSFDGYVYKVRRPLRKFRGNS